MARKNTLIEDFAADRRQELTAGRFEFARGSAAFSNPHTVVVEGHGTLTSDRFLIATGSVVVPPPLPGIHKIGYLTSDDALTLKELPASMIILGGGPVAVEFAQCFSRMGTSVTLLQRGGHILSGFDTDAAEVLAHALSREGVEILTQTKLIDARCDGNLKAITFTQDGKPASVSAEMVLSALGRQPDLASLHLENAGVATKDERIETNEFMQTNVPHIYAAGDCTGPHEILHHAVAQGEIAAYNMARPDDPKKFDCRLMLAVIFTDPQVASVGLTEKQATARGIPYQKVSHRFDDHGKSIIMNATDGFVKLLAAPDTGEIIGGAAIGPLAGELIHEIVVAMAKRMTVHELAAIPHYHPTLAEIWTYPAADLGARIPAVT